MPQLSRFFGIIISMYFDDHDPPHFHARYNEFIAKIEIESLEVIKGELPSRVLGLVIEWAADHKEGLMKDWGLMKEGKPMLPISPLK